MGGSTCFSCHASYEEGGFYWCDHHRVYHCPDPDCRRSCTTALLHPENVWRPEERPFSSEERDA